MAVLVPCKKWLVQCRLLYTTCTLNNSLITRYKKHTAMYNWSPCSKAISKHNTISKYRIQQMLHKGQTSNSAWRADGRYCSKWVSVKISTMFHKLIYLYEFKFFYCFKNMYLLDLRNLVNKITFCRSSLQYALLRIRVGASFWYILCKATPDFELRRI